MHDVHRDSILYKDRGKKIKKQDHLHSHEGGSQQQHSDDRQHNHGEQSPGGQGSGTQAHGRHDHPHDHGHDHDHRDPGSGGHDHQHAPAAYDEHDHDLHIHHHDHQEFQDRAITHLHEHGHNFFHSHHHNHDPEHTTLTHKLFKDPVRDWFAAFLMGLLILAGYLQWLPGHLSDGMLICAAVIGIFPVLKNAIFDCLARRALSFELLAGILLVAGLLWGKFLAAALISLFLLIGSFMRLNFSWRDQ